nr:Chain C, Ribosome biogenesis protein NOP53 [Saccharomyces cerevisiae S288C]5OOQ_D Chain D, Ribosome biogenesis protein NOP53 [Saccharomyces cerevisiae S288C]
GPDSMALFHVDVEGDEILKNKLIKRKQIKKVLKSKEIL